MDGIKAFDAVETYLCEGTRNPSAAWRTVSLVTALLGLITRGPEFETPTPEARLDAFRAAADELSRRGLDALALVRYGMTREVAAPVIGALAVRLIFGEGASMESMDVQGWCAALGLQGLPSASPRPNVNEIGRLFEEWILPAIPNIYRWIGTASLDDLINLTPPARDSLELSSDTEPLDRDLREQYRWAVEHFAKTFYGDWQTSSLHYELKWLDGEVLPPCPNELMNDRKVPREKIAEEIARRVVYDVDKYDPGESLVSEMTRHAISLLRQDRCNDAAAVFEFGVLQRPDDADIRNNLGFCLIPVDPRKALDALKCAANMSYEPSSTNSYNQICCYISIGRPRAALNVADEEWRKEDSKGHSAVLWRRRSDGTWELFDSEDSLTSIAHLCVEIARDEGWADQERTWKTRCESTKPEASELLHPGASDNRFAFASDFLASTRHLLINSGPSNSRNDGLGTIQ